MDTYTSFYKTIENMDQIKKKFYTVSKAKLSKVKRWWIGDDDDAMKFSNGLIPTIEMYKICLEM